jgi:N-hydroxyarylamine O-acetyltransferase
MIDDMLVGPGRNIDFKAYFDRIAYCGGRQPVAETLRDLHMAHATHIPFENLDVMLRRPIRLDLESLEQKLVGNRRGGYCFEQNLFFAAVLERLGFMVTLLQARVRFRAQRVLPRTHVALVVDLAGDRWLADLGFGSCGLIAPLPLVVGEYQQFAWTYRLARESDEWVLQAPVRGIWQDLYVFTLEPQLAVDFEVPNHYVSTHPDSRFVQTLTVQRVAPETRHVLRNTELTTTTPAGDICRTLTSNAELLETLARQFGLDFPAGTEFLPASTWAVD